MRGEYAFKAEQRGMALVLSLIFLAIVTLVSLSSMQGSMLQGRMAVNQQDYSAALQAAEAGLKEAEAGLQDNRMKATNAISCQANNRPTKDTLQNQNGWTHYQTGRAGDQLDTYFCTERVTELGSSVTSSNVEIVELLYKIVATGFGHSQETAVTLEVLFISAERVGS